MPNTTNTTTDRMAEAILAEVARRNASKAEGVWKDSKEGKSYEHYAPLGQIHATINGEHFGFNITVFHYGEAKPRRTKADLEAEIARLKALTGQE